MTRKEALKRLSIGIPYFVAQIVIIPVLIAIGILVGLISILNTLIIGKGSGGGRFGKSLSRSSRWTRDALDWNFGNLHRVINGPISSFKLLPPSPV